MSVVLLRLSRKQRRLVRQHGKPLPQLLFDWYWVERLTLDQVAERAQVTRGTAQEWLSRYELTRTAMAEKARAPVPA